MGDVLEFDLLKSFQFKRKKGRGRPSKLSKTQYFDKFSITITYWNYVSEEYMNIVLDKECPFVNLTLDGKRAAIEALNKTIIDICEQDPSVGAEYMEVVERAIMNYRENDKKGD